MRVAIEHIVSHFDHEVSSRVDTDVMVVGEVTDPVSNNSPTGDYMAILSISESGHVWSPGEIADLPKGDLQLIYDALWDAFMLAEKAEEIGDLLQTHVKLALSEGTDPNRIRNLLATVKRAVLGNGRAA